MNKTLISCIIILLCACSKQSGEITLHEAWIREAPPNASAMAGYLRIENSSSQDQILTFVKSQDFNSVEIHRTIFENGIAKMRRQEQLMIPANGTLELKPGDYHLMLMSPQSHYQDNDEVIVTLCIKNGDVIDEYDVSMLVKKI